MPDRFCGNGVRVWHDNDVDDAGTDTLISHNPAHCPAMKFGRVQPYRKMNSNRSSGRKNWQKSCGQCGSGRGDPLMGISVAAEIVCALLRLEKRVGQGYRVRILQPGIVDVLRVDVEEHRHVHLLTWKCK